MGGGEAGERTMGPVRQALAPGDVQHAHLRAKTRSSCHGTPSLSKRRFDLGVGQDVHVWVKKLSHED